MRRSCAELAVRTSWPRRDLLIVSVAGEVDLVTAPILADELRAAGVRTLVVDLSEVSFIGAAGLSVLHASARRERGRTGLVANTRAVLRPLSVVAFDAAPVFPALPVALRALACEPHTDSGEDRRLSG
jgi:anti-anti-sigma factor